MKLNDVASNDHSDIANLFKTHFETVYKQKFDFDADKFDHISSLENELSTIELSEEDVRKALNSLDVRKGPGPDLIPAKFLNSTSNTICKFVCKIYNTSLKVGVFPEIWKTSFVIPVFKSGDRSDIVNYRGISILPAPSKVFEGLIHKPLSNFFETILDQSQHGFQSGRSTMTNLLEHTEYNKISNKRRPAS